MRNRTTATFLIAAAALAACSTDEVTAPGRLVDDIGTPMLAVAPSSPTFVRPFSTGLTVPTLNFMDHNVPLQGIDTNGRMVTHWNETSLAGVAGSGGHVDGHSGYDWRMVVGTPLVAVAPGTVTAAFMTHAPVFCQALGVNVTTNSTIEIEHVLSGGTRVRTRYIHVNSIAVTPGASVTSGQMIGTSGNRGCSLAPHLHFEVVRLVPPFSWRLIDPYGWTSTATDPWSTNANGVESINLWRSGAAPPLFREDSILPNPTGSQAVVTITKVRWMGINDAANRNNEFIELTLDTRYGSSASLAGFQIKGDRANFTYNLPSSASLTTARPTIRIFTGAGTNTTTTLFMNRASPVWSNDHNDCARRVNTTVNPPLVYSMSLGGTC